MDITNVTIRQLMDKPQKRLLAVASATIGGELALHDMKIIQGDTRLFVAMPSRRDDSGQWHDIYHPIGSKAREQLEAAVLEAYHEEVRHSER